MQEQTDEQPRRAGPEAGIQRRESPARDGMALGLAVGTSGLAFGAAAVSDGLSTAQACVLSLLAYTGASPFALAGAGPAGGLAGGAPRAGLPGRRRAPARPRVAGRARRRAPGP